MRRRDRKGGYLVVEALATLALGALMLAALAAFTGGMLRIGDRIAGQVETIEVDGRALATVADEVRRIARLRWSGEGDARPFVFAGDPTQISFALAPEQANGLRAPVVVVWQSAEGGDLLRAEGPLEVGAAAIGDVPLGPVRRIARGQAALRFAYVGRTPGGGEVITDAWAQPMALPAAVRIDRVDPRTGRRLTSLRVPLLTDAEPGCADPQKGLCSRVPRKEQPKQAGFGASARTGPTPQNPR